MKNKRSSSINWINADYPMNRVERRLYFVLNGLNNSFPHLFRDKQVAYRDFRCSNLEGHWKKIQPLRTPPRKLCDLFLLETPWARLQQELGELHVLECGCGSGRYGEFLMTHASAPPASYTGIDLKKPEQWQVYQDTYPNFTFHQLKGNDISEFIPEHTNVILSISALEHFEEDLYYFRQVHDFIESRKRNILQIHLFPSGPCLKLFGHHGIRQYTPRTLRSITELFHPFSYSVLFNLGGKESNRVHYRHIRLPLESPSRNDNLKKTDPEAYDRLTYEAIQKDMSSPGSAPTFYALVIHSYFKQRLFD
jgi:SAM-dependent methyltransferase